MSGPDKNTSIIASRECQSLRPHLTQQTSRLPSSNADLWWDPASSTNLFGAFSLRPSVRLIISCFSLLSTPHLEVGKIHLSFFRVLQHGRVHHIRGRVHPPTNVTKSLVMNEARSFPEGDNNKSCSFRSLKKKKNT